MRKTRTPIYTHIYLFLFLSLRFSIFFLAFFAKLQIQPSYFFFTPFPFSGTQPRLCVSFGVYLRKNKYNRQHTDTHTLPESQIVYIWPSLFSFPPRLSSLPASLFSLCARAIPFLLSHSFSAPATNDALNNTSWYQPSSHPQSPSPPSPGVPHPQAYDSSPPVQWSQKTSPH